MTTIDTEQSNLHSVQFAGVKPLEWSESEDFHGVMTAPSALGIYRVDEAFQTPTTKGIATVLPSWRGPFDTTYTECASIDAAKAAAQADYEARIMAALSISPEPEGVVTPSDAFARWVKDGPRLAKAAGLYVGITVYDKEPSHGRS